MVIVKKNDCGFTLIELLLATSLLMMVLFSGYYGYSLYMQKWQKRTQHFWLQSQKALAFDVLSRVFESTVPYIVNSDNNEPAQYFSGDQQRVIFISNSPLFSKETAVVEFKILQNQGYLSLAYNEATLTNNLLLQQSDVIKWDHQVILIDNLQDISFQYFGWDSLQQVINNYGKDEDNNTDEELSKAKRYNEHIMEERRILPISIFITMTAQTGEKSEFPVVLPEESYSILVDYLMVGV
ncbi:PulJ/GspJ family protein [Pseudoalteromonas tunicata]|uniref:PulJ/GspJ family protein n=1 Tax=Pseudoalteromonas tunicata TaxID=314281 RepID=UPI00273E3B97|nr:prepilin-type N-terminal cleavage/methylation domain-containing protein [Pseudoalteromonas tunicata]MDP4985454.1 prepilin-type N-terminal cleavage/methylation domain-containing protein [Pseudoalteromonas tunicata]MDP5213570.1 prepilin-type N-terminal cleavage/methylation domain-containing protein [Pseudoalteromonas tunicata]